MMKTPPSSSSSLLSATRTGVLLCSRVSTSLKSSFSQYSLRIPTSLRLPFIRRHRYINSVNGENIVTKMTESIVNISGNMIFEPILEEGVFRFDCSGYDRDTAFPSHSFTDTKLRDTPLSIDKVPVCVPTFERVNGQQIVTIKFPSGTNFYGTGEASGQLERTGKRASGSSQIYTWNTDAWGYGPGTTSLYQSHPWVLSVLPNGEAIGVLADTTQRCEVDLRKESTIQIIAPSSYPLITFGPFGSPTAVLISLSHAIGTVFMPPKWSLGYHQCRWSYDSDVRVLEVAKTFRKKGIPCDVIWMDIDYMDGFRCFTFDKERFPNPKLLVDDLHLNGFKAIWMLDPGIKQEEGYFVYDSGSESDAWIQNAEGKPYVGEVWPGPCVFPDFTQEKTRSWWARLVKDFMSNGVDGIWNDMNEPAVFKTVTKTMPNSNIHRGDEALGGHQNHSHYHNVYGMLMTRSTYEGMKMGNENKRPFVLTRAGFIGSQRYAATWTGDNLSNWEHLQMSTPMVLQLGLSGQPLSGPDLGGFAGNATPKLFGRWMAVGAMFPFCRGHSEAGTTDHEPWSFGEEISEWMVRKQEFDVLDSDYGVRIDLMTKVFGIDAAERYFESLPLSAKTGETYTALLHSYAGAKLVEKAERLFERAKGENVSLNAITYNEMMTLYMSVGQLEKVPLVIEELKRQKVSPDLFTYNLWISSSASNLDIDSVKRILDEMSSDSNSSDGWVIYRQLTNLYITAGNLVNSECNSIVETEKKITQRECITYDFLIILYTGLKNKERIDQIWKSLRVAPMKMTSRNYICIISSYLMLGHFKGASEVFEQWKQSATTDFDTQACNRLLDAFTKTGLVEKAEMLRSLMTQNTFNPKDESQ